MNKAVKNEVASESIRITPSIKFKLDKCKLYPRETFDDVIARLLDENKRVK